MSYNNNNIHNSAAKSDNNVGFDISSLIDFPPLPPKGKVDEDDSSASLDDIPPLVDGASVSSEESEDDVSVFSEETLFSHLEGIPTSFQHFICDEPKVVSAKNYRIYDAYIEWSRVQQYIDCYFGTSVFRQFVNTPVNKLTEDQFRGSPHFHFIEFANARLTQPYMMTTTNETTENHYDEEMEMVD